MTQKFQDYIDYRDYIKHFRYRDSPRVHTDLDLERTNLRPRSRRRQSRWVLTVDPIRVRLALMLRALADDLEPGADCRRRG